MVLSPIVCALQPHRKTAAMNLLHSFYCIGAVVTVLVASLALKYDFGWRPITLWLMLAPAAVGLGLAVVPLPPLVPHGKERTRLRELVRVPAFLVTLAAIFLGGATELGMAQWLPDYAQDALHYSKWAGGMALLAFSVAMAVGRIAVGMMGPRLNPVRLMFHLCWISVVLFLVGSFAPIAPVALAACILAGLTGSCLWPSILGVAADEFPQGGASMFAMLAAMGNFGGVFMPWAVGVTADHSSMHWGLSTGAICPLLLAAILVWMSRRRRNPA
jgi:fucose permease